MATDYYGWVPPTLAQANITQGNCEVAATWLAVLLNSLAYSPDYITLPFAETYNYVLALTPDDQQKPTMGQMADWLWQMDPTSDYMLEMISFPTTECPTELCKNLVWGGDADLAGVGVMVVYFLAAGLVTLYFALLAADKWEPFRDLERHHRRWKFFVGAFQETVGSFIDTGLLFAITTLVSGVYRHTSSRLHPDKTHSIYQLTNATYIGVFSIFPPLLLQIITPTKRRRRIRVALWLLTIVLGVALIALYFNLETSLTRLLNLLDRLPAESDTIWEINCEPLNLRDDLDIAIVTACAMLALNLLPWLYHTVMPRKARHNIRNSTFIGRLNATKPQRLGRSWWSHVRLVALVVDGVVCCLMMWALLGLFTAYRSIINHKMGPTNSNGEWSFSQVFALATWVPVTIDLVTMYIYGARDAHEAKISENFCVVENQARDARRSMGLESLIGGRAASGFGGREVDYANIDPLQLAEPSATHFNAGNTQYAAAAGHYDDSAGQYIGGQYAGGQYGGQYDPQYTGAQYAPQYDPSMSKEATSEVQPMVTYVQPAPYNGSSLTGHLTGYEYQVPDPTAAQHGYGQPGQHGGAPQ
ncbi:MAG: hypothetical protein STHCBS139747_004039 [Sporothrix thermara]